MGRKGEQTRRRMIEATGTLLRKQGYNGTGLKEILREAGAPRGSLYFHFPGGKEELACAALELAGSELRDQLQAVFNPHLSPGQALGLAVQVLTAQLKQSDFRDGCPMATVALEASAESETIRETCAEMYRSWERVIRERLVSAGADIAEATRGALLALSSIEGALMLSRVYRDVGPLLAVGEALMGLIPQEV